MKRAGAVLGSAIFLAIAPGTVAVYVPWIICHWHVAPPLLGLFSLRAIGALMIAAGLPVLLDSFSRFAFQGLGTPVPAVNYIDRPATTMLAGSVGMSSVSLW